MKTLLCLILIFALVFSNVSARKIIVKKSTNTPEAKAALNAAIAHGGIPPKESSTEEADSRNLQQLPIGQCYWFYECNPNSLPGVEQEVCEPKLLCEVHG